MDVDADAKKTEVYDLLDVAETSRPPTVSTPAVRDQLKWSTDAKPETSRFLGDIDFETPKPFVWNCPGGYKQPTPEDTSGAPWSAEDAFFVRGHRRTPMKPGKFDGTGSLESFLAQFEVCARHNRWSELDKVDFIRCALEKAATQLLWDFAASENVTYGQLVERLRQRYGTEGQAETFRAQLYYRRQRTDES